MSGFIILGNLNDSICLALIGCDKIGRHPKLAPTGYLHQVTIFDSIDPSVEKFISNLEQNFTQPIDPPNKSPLPSPSFVELDKLCEKISEGVSFG